jgi:hypothetical protein
MLDCHDGRMQSRRNSNDAPVLPFDYKPDGQPIWPCTDCLPWHVEVVESPEEGVIIREWHAVGCKVWDDNSGEIPSTED